LLLEKKKGKEGTLSKEGTSYQKEKKEGRGGPKLVKARDTHSKKGGKRRGPMPQSGKALQRR